MAIQAESLEVQVRATGVDTTVRDVNRVPTAVNKAASATEQAGARAKRGGAGFSAAGALIKAAAGTMVLSMGGKMVMAASDLNEQMSKVGVVFGTSAKTVTRNADEMARRFGLSKTVMLDAAGGIGLVAKASGLAQPAAAKLSNQLGNLAADASSFYNVPIEEALEAMKSGLVGEAEPMRRFGVLLNEAAVQTEAVRLGIAKQNDELTEGQKVQARSSLIIKGMTDASGDLERTQGSVSNRLREVQGRIQNYAADLGTKALPLVADFLEKLIETAPKIEDFARGLAQDLTPAFSMMKDAGQGAIDLFNSIPDPLKSTAFQVGAVGLAVSKTSGFIQTGLDYLGDYKSRMTEAGRSTIAFRGAAGILGATAFALGELADEGTETGRALSGLADVAGGALLGFAVGGPIGAAVGGLAGLLKTQLTAGNNAAADSFVRNREEARSFKDTLDQVTGAVTRATRAQALKALQDTVAIEAGNKLGIAQRDLIGATLGEKAARERVLDAIKAGNKVRDQEKLRLDNGALAHQALEQALFGVKGMTEGTADAFRKQQRELKGEIEATKTWREALKGIPKRVQTILENKGYDVSRNQVLDLVRKYDLTPKQKTTLFKALGIEKVSRDAKKASDDLDALGRKRAEPKADLDITKAQRNAAKITQDLLKVHRFEAMPKADLLDRAFQAKAKDAQSRLRILDGTFADPTISARDQATPIIARVAGQLRNIDGDVAVTYVRTIFQQQGKSDRMTGGFASGGYTGPGGKYDVAGFVHRGEYVLDAETTRNARGIIEALHASRGRMVGHADGGPAGVPGRPKPGGKDDVRESVRKGTKEGQKDADKERKDRPVKIDAETRSQIIGVQIEIRDLKKELAKTGKEALTGLERKRAQADLAAANKELSALRKGPAPEKPEKPVNWGWLGNLADGVKKGIDGAETLKKFRETIRQNTKGKEEKRLLDMKALDRLSTQNGRLAQVQADLTKAIEARDAIVQEANTFRGTVQEGMSRQANVLNSGRTAGDIAASLGVQVGKAQEFAAAIQALRAKGYSDGIVMQVAAAGTEGGLEVAKALLAASPGEAQAITQSFNTIASIAQQASAGVTSQMYDTGIQAAEGVVSGLEAREAKIEATLVRIAEKIAKVLRKKLKVKSPSRLTAEIGEFTGEGLVVGLVSKEQRIAAKAAKIGSVLAAGLQTGIGTGPTLPGGLRGTQGLTPAALGSGSTAGGVTFQFQTYNPVAEPESRTTNKALDRVAALSLV